MKLTGRDLPKLWLPLLAALAMFLVAGLLVWGSQLDAGKAEQERSVATAAKNQIEQRLRQVRTEEQEIRERTQLLQQLQNSGITGDEKRLDWMEMLRETQRELRIPGMSYEFGAQTSLDKGEDATYTWFSSPLLLKLRLLHEEDLLNFLARVEKNARALVIVRSCKLVPLPSQANGREVMAQLSAECDMQWLTARPASGKK
ncbi:MAG: hypothetical protein FD131_2650 [Rhodocyclaceae bacterium]|nr:MAG: hypothetical protein FD131_2650 [Rhodocyclaceae bacterium]